ncbi:MAG: transporter substrate-binding domain-containing protein [Calditrichaeota bacterium]|nr:transporter substrate-binding domain-containing protein [Calditrichota bacterium]
MKTILFLLILINLAISQKKEITVIFSNENTKLVRYELELAKELINFYAKTNKQKIDIKYKGISVFDDNFKYINEANENSFALGAISITPQRQKNYDFSQPYMVNKLSLLAREDYVLKADQPIKLAYQSGTIYESTLDKVRSLYTIKAIPQKNSLTSAQSLKNKQVDMIYADFVDSWNFNLKLIRHVDLDWHDEYGMMFKKGSAFKKEIDDTFTKYKKTPAYYKLIKKHFGDYSQLFFNL